MRWKNNAQRDFLNGDINEAAARLRNRDSARSVQNENGRKINPAVLKLRCQAESKNIRLCGTAQIMAKGIRFLTRIAKLEVTIALSSPSRGREVAKLIYDANYSEQLINSLISNWIELIGLLAWKAHFVQAQCVLGVLHKRE